MKKGFTLIELIVSFCLTAAIMVVLFQLIFAVKDLYISGNVKTTLVDRQSIITNKIYKDLNEKELTNINSCGVTCLEFTFNDNSKTQLFLDIATNTVTYDNYAWQLETGSNIGNVNFKNQCPNNSTTCYFKINIPITNKLIEKEDFGIYILKTYSSSKTTVESISKNNVRIANQNYEIASKNVPERLDQNSGISLSGKFIKLHDAEEIINLVEYMDIFKITDNTLVIQYQDYVKDSSFNYYYELATNTSDNIEQASDFVQYNKIGETAQGFAAVDGGAPLEEANGYIWIRIDDYIRKYAFIK